MKGIKVDVSKKQMQKWIDDGLSQKQMAEKAHCSYWTIIEIGKKYGLKFNGASLLNKGDKNSSKREEIKKKISQSVKNKWDEGAYQDRINGMKDMKGELHHNFDPAKHSPEYLAKTKYVDFLSRYEDVSFCHRCDTKTKKINIHHIDEDRENFLPSNLEPLCVPCHSHFHYSLQQQPFVCIGKKFSFAAAHWLPNYDGPCHNLHGHEWSGWIYLKKRIDKKTGMVMDFSYLKQIIEKHIISLFDHSCLNDHIVNPTAENILIRVWEILMFDAHLKGIEKIELNEAPSSIASLTKKGMLSILSLNIESYLVK